MEDTIPLTPALGGVLVFNDGHPASVVSFKMGKDVGRIVFFLASEKRICTSVAYNEWLSKFQFS
jgi:hypothetical protein